MTEEAEIDAVWLRNSGQDEWLKPPKLTSPSQFKEEEQHNDGLP